VAVDFGLAEVELPGADVSVVPFVVTLDAGVSVVVDCGDTVFSVVLDCGDTDVAVVLDCGDTDVAVVLDCGDTDVAVVLDCGDTDVAGVVTGVCDDDCVVVDDAALVVVDCSVVDDAALVVVDCSVVDDAAVVVLDCSVVVGLVVSVVVDGGVGNGHLGVSMHETANGDLDRRQSGYVSSHTEKHLFKSHVAIGTQTEPISTLVQFLPVVLKQQTHLQVTPSGS